MFLSILLRKSIFVFLAFFVLWVGEAIIGGIETFSKVKGMQGPQRSEVLQNDFFFSKWRNLKMDTSHCATENVIS
jgi:hypothetical protein